MNYEANTSNGVVLYKCFPSTDHLPLPDLNTPAPGPTQEPTHIPNTVGSNQNQHSFGSNSNNVGSNSNVMSHGIVETPNGQIPTGFNANPSNLFSNHVSQNSFTPPVLAPPNLLGSGSGIAIPPKGAAGFGSSSPSYGTSANSISPPHGAAGFGDSSNLGGGSAAPASFMPMTGQVGDYCMSYL